MKRNTLKVTVIVAAVATIGFLVTACPNSNNQEEDKKPDTGMISKELQGTWKSDAPRQSFNFGEREYKIDLAVPSHEPLRGLPINGGTVSGLKVEAVKNTNADEAANAAFPNGYKLTGTVPSGLTQGRQVVLYILFSKDS